MRRIALDRMCSSIVTDTQYSVTTAVQVCTVATVPRLGLIIHNDASSAGKIYVRFAASPALATKQFALDKGQTWFDSYKWQGVVYIISETGTAVVDVSILT